MENSEEILEELIEYDKNPTATIPQSLETYLKQIAKTGYTRFPWQRIKTLFKVKLENVIADFSGVSAVETVPVMPNVEIFKYEEMKTRIFEQLESYSGVPFTIQRICELITQPYDYYKRIDKFMRGLERVMLVFTIIDPNPVPGGGLATSISNGFSPDLTFNLAHDSLEERQGPTQPPPATNQDLSVPQNIDDAKPIPEDVSKPITVNNDSYVILPKLAEINGLEKSMETTNSTKDEVQSHLSKETPSLIKKEMVSQAAASVTVQIPKPILPNHVLPKKKKIKCGKSSPAHAPPVTRQRSKHKEPVLEEAKNREEPVLEETKTSFRHTQKDAEKPVLKPSRKFCLNSENADLKQSKKPRSKTRKSNEKPVLLDKKKGNEKSVLLDKKKGDEKTVLLRNMKKNRGLEMTEDCDYLTSDDEFVFIDNRHANKDKKILLKYQNLVNQGRLH